MNSRGELPSPPPLPSVERRVVARTLVVLVEGGDLRTSIRWALTRSSISVVVAGLMAASMVLVETPAVGAVAAHAPRHMPNVVGLPKSDVYAAMRGAQLYFRTKGPGSADGQWASVKSQNPRAGALVSWHSTVTLTVWRQAGHALRRVPWLTGLSKARVYAAMRRAQLFFVTKGSGSASGHWVAALHQSPAPGRLVRWHSTVVVTTSTHRPTKKRAVPVTTTTRHQVTTTTKPPSRATTTTAATTSIPSSTTTYPGETTTTGLSTTTTPSSTTTTVKPRATTTTLKKKPARFRIGLATWYSYFPGRCATSYLPMGTHITVRALATGRTVHCVVTDRQPPSAAHAVDLSETDFVRLAPLSTGIVRVKVSW